MKPKPAAQGADSAGRKKRYRFERKYYLTSLAADILRQRVSWILRPDRHSQNGSYRVSSLYFDDAHNTSLYQKQNGILLRNKLRIRYYNNSPDFMRLEHKHKYGEMICKENTTVSLARFESIRSGQYGFALDETDPLWQMFYARRVTMGLRPTVLVEYDREAFTYVPGNVRVTFDTGLTASLPYSKHYLSAQPENRVILEVKYDSFLPAVVSGLLSGMQFTQLAISKYVLCREILDNAFRRAA